MKLVVWNILHGGGPHRTPEIALTLIEHRPDVVVLLEFRGPRGGQLRAVLADAGLAYQFVSPAPPCLNGVLIASRWIGRESMQVQVPPVLAPKLLAVELETSTLGSLTLVGVHVPDDGSPTARARTWESLVEFARGHQCRALIAGDLNTGRHRVDEQGSTFTHTKSLGELAMAGYVDVWRKHNPSSPERTWAGSDPISRVLRPGGSRIDAVWASADLAKRVNKATLWHAQRTARVSDHSLLSIEFAPSEAPHEG